MCPLLKREERHSIFLLHLIHLPRFLSFLSFSHTSFLSPAPRMNVSLFQIPAPGLHTPICLQMLLFTVSPTVCVCVCARACVCVTMRVGEWDCWIPNSRKCCTCGKKACRTSEAKCISSEPDYQSSLVSLGLFPKLRSNIHVCANYIHCHEQQPDSRDQVTFIYVWMRVKW